MIDLLVKSLMSDQGLENALTTAIAYEAQDPAAVLKAAGTESSVPLIQLIQHLVGNSTARQLAFLKQVVPLQLSLEIRYLLLVACTLGTRIQRI